MFPNWLTTIKTTTKVWSHRFKLFKDVPRYALEERPIGHWDWTIEYASAELALLELIHDIKEETDFTVADKYFESATTLRPKIVNNLLTTCTMVQAKRLFLWFAKRHNLHWVDSLNLSEINLGKGKRMIIKGGKLDKELQITVPKRMANGFQSDFF